MGVRVRVRITCRDMSSETVALLNSGFESSEPDIAVPTAVARDLGLWPPQSFELETVSTAGGDVQVFYIGNEPCTIELLDEHGRPLDSARCKIIIDPHLDETLLSDYIIDELGITVISFRRGLWRHRSDPPDTVRHSA